MQSRKDNNEKGAVWVASKSSASRVMTIGMQVESGEELLEEHLSRHVHAHIHHKHTNKFLISDSAVIAALNY